VNDKLAETLAQIAERLGFEAVRVWPQIVMLTWLEAVFWVIVDPIIIALALVGFFKALHRFKATKDSTSETDTFEDFPEPLLAAMVMVICAGIAFSFLFGFAGYLPAVFYPEAKTVLKLAGK